MRSIMSLSSRREQLLVRLLGERGWTVTERRTLPMMGGDVVETTLWWLTARDGRKATLSIVAEIGFGAGFPPVLRAVDGHLAADAARSADGIETALDENAAETIASFLDSV